MCIVQFGKITNGKQSQLEEDEDMMTTRMGSLWKCRSCGSTGCLSSHSCIKKPADEGKSGGSTSRGSLGKKISWSTGVGKSTVGFQMLLSSSSFPLLV